MGQGDWIDPNALKALCWLLIDDKKGNPHRPISLPPCIFRGSIAPFLRFDAPQPNQLYALGGRNQGLEPLDTAEMFDTWHGRWVACPSMMHQRAGCAAAALPNGNLIVVGGYNDKGIVAGLLSSCEIFNPSSQTWNSDCPPLHRSRWGHGCASLGGLVYAVGGCSLRPGSPAREAFMETLKECEVYNHAENAWTLCPSLRIARAGSRVVVLGERYLAAVGGCEDVFGRAEMLASVELFDPTAQQWSLLDVQLSTPRTTAAVAALDERHILIFGGAPSLSSAEVYRVPPRSDPDECSARRADEANDGPSACDMAEGRMGCQAAQIDLPAPGQTYPLCTRPCIVVVGGENGDEDFDARVRQFSSVLVFDAEAKAWRPEGEFPPIPTPRTAMAICVAPGKVTCCS